MAALFAFKIYNMERITELREKAGRLPLSPGVYLMKDKKGKIIYVGKSKALKNRVSQYFQDNEKSIKTFKMVSNVYDFDYILTNTEIEALVLENKLIKLNQPKYNILLKDAKSYPYIKINIKDPYPRVEFTRRRNNDGSKYFGPYSGAGAVYNILKTIQNEFSVARCKFIFPRDIGKKPCLYYHLGNCVAPCTGNISSEEYKQIIDEIILFLNGKNSELSNKLTEKMLKYSSELKFEEAASIRNRLSSLKQLWNKQKIEGAPVGDYDVFSYYSDDLCSCISSYKIRNGVVTDSSFFPFDASAIIDDYTACSFISGLYQKGDYIPALMLGFNASDESISLIREYLYSLDGKNAIVKVPQKGKFKDICEMVRETAESHAKDYLHEIEKKDDLLIELAKLLSLEVVPENIEAIDISNFGNDNIIAGIISIKNGSFSKSDYRLYKMKATNAQDDYASMSEAITRRMSHIDDLPLPDLILLDGGQNHVRVIKSLLSGLKVDVPVIGMVKDSFHKTRTLTDGSNEIDISRDTSVFSFIYKIQEEVHRYTIRNMHKGKSKSLKKYSLEEIEGIGPQKAKNLMSSFKNISTIKNASIEELKSVKMISERDAEAIYNYFRTERKS